MDKKIRTIIIDDNSSATSSLKEYLNSCSNIEVVTTFSNGEDALTFMINHSLEFDLVVMDVILPKLDGIALLEELKSRNIEKKVIILSSYKNDRLVKQCSQYNVSYYILKPFNYVSLEKRILETCDFSSDEQDGQSLDLEVSQILHNLGIPTHIRGFKYIREGILILYSKENEISYITKDIYPLIAEKFDTTPTRVERAIRHAIEVSYIQGDLGLIEDLFGYSVGCEKAKPTNAEFLTTIADRLKINSSFV